LEGNLDIPKILSSLAAQAIAENNAADASYLVFGHETVGPKNVSANTVYGRQWFYQSSLNVDTLLFKHLEYAKNDKVENLAFNGTGLGNEPLGILNEDGITDVDLSTVSFENIMQPKTVIKKAKAFDGIFKWLVSPDVETKMQTTPIMAGQSPMLMDLNTNKMVGFDSEWTNQIPVNNLAFGNWPALMLLFWGVDELLVDPYTLSTAGSVRMTIFTMFNKFIQQEAAFNISSNVSISA
jgi:HK97 family phage major capsid protein